MNFEISRLMTILEEARHSLLIIEHDPTLYEDATGMIELVSQAMSDASKEAALLLYLPGIDPFLEDLTRNADRVFYFDEGPRAAPEVFLPINVFTPIFDNDDHCKKQQCHFNI